MARSNDVHHERGERSTERRTDHGAYAKNSVEPLGFLRREHVRRYDPALRNQSDTEQTDEGIEEIQKPGPAVREQMPDQHKYADHEEGCACNCCLQGKPYSD